MPPAHSLPPLPAPVLAVLRCPVCGSDLREEPGRLACARGHSFDRARQGHVTLRRGTRTPVNADTPGMVAARASLLDSGIYSPIRDRVADLVADSVARAAAGLLDDTDHAPGVVVDLAGGTGYYLAGVLDRLPGAHGICVDLSTAAMKRAARVHPRAVAVGADVSATLPLGEASVAAVTSLFGPRDLEEVARVLRPGGVCCVVTAADGHLAELIAPLGMVAVHPGKGARLDAELAGLDQVASEVLTYPAPVSRAQARDLVLMGPSAHHVTEAELATRVGALPETASTTVSVHVRVVRPR